MLYAVDLVASPTSVPTEPARIVPFPHSEFDGLGDEPLSKLIELERERAPSERTLDFPLAAIGRAVYHTRIRTAAAWMITPILFKQENLARAARYLSDSQQEFFVFQGQLPEVINDEIAKPNTGWEKSRVETALWNAFRTIEALIGEPSSDQKKFKRKLNLIGIDPEEQFGFPRKIPLIDFLYEFQIARDKSAAHGATPFESVTIKELFLYQDCASYLLLKLIEAGLDDGLYD